MLHGFFILWLHACPDLDGVSPFFCRHNLPHLGPYIRRTLGFLCSGTSPSNHSVSWLVGRGILDEACLSSPRLPNITTVDLVITDAPDVSKGLGDIVKIQFCNRGAENVDVHDVPWTLVGGVDGHKQSLPWRAMDTHKGVPAHLPRIGSWRFANNVLCLSCLSAVGVAVKNSWWCCLVFVFGIPDELCLFVVMDDASLG